MSNSRPDIVGEYSNLGVNSFPTPVEQFLSTASLSSPNLSAKIKTRFATSGLDDTEESQLKKISEMIKQDKEVSAGAYSNPDDEVAPDERVSKQLLGTICTFLRTREQVDLSSQSKQNEDAQKIRFNVSNLSNGNTLYLLYPGNKAFRDTKYPHPFDFQVYLEGYDGTGNKKQMPRHNDFFSDLWWKLKEGHLIKDSPELVRNWKRAVAEVFCGESPHRIRDKYSDLDDYNVGRTSESILLSVYWILAQEDFNYPRPVFDGREYTYRPASEILDSSPSQFGSNTGHYGGPEDHSDYSRYYKILDPIAGHSGELIPNSELQKDCYSL
jgi:hypothetical protein